MKAVVLAGGYSSRFYPYNKAGHKTMVKIMGKPILQYTLEGLKAAGIKDIIIRVSLDRAIKDYFGDGGSFGLNISYIEQEEALGMGEVLLNAEKFLDGDFILISGNHVNSQALVKELTESKGESKAVVLAKQRENVADYGVIELKDGKLIKVVEKPEKGQETSKLTLVSAFLLPLEIIGIVKTLQMSEFNFEQEALAIYAKDNPIAVKETSNETVTLKYPWNLLHVKNFLMNGLTGRIDSSAKVAEDAQVDENVVIESGAHVMGGAKIKGPAYIGKNVTVGTNALIRNETDLEDGVSIGAFTEIKNALIMSATSVHSGFIGDSIVGANCKIGSGFTTGNRRIDRGVIEVMVKGEKIPTDLTSFGAIVGNGAKIGIKASTMPGVIIGNNATVGPSTSIFKNVDDDVTYYAKFQEIVEKK